MAPVGYDTALEEVVALGKTLSHSLPSELVALYDAVGRVASESISSSEPRPAFDVSAMDGFAVNSASTASASLSHPVVLRVLDHITAGFAPPKFSSETETPSLEVCYGINTGARFPNEVNAASPHKAFFDSVIPLERVDHIRTADGKLLGYIKIISPVRPLANKRQAGEDYSSSHPLLSRGMRLEPKHVLVLASASIQQVRVFKKPTIGIITTGEEIKPGDHQKGSIPDCSSPYLKVALQSWGYDVEVLGAVGDSQDTFEAVVRDNLESFDLLVSTGAVSASKSDFVPRALASLDATTHFRKVDIRPGHPVMLASVPPTTTKSSSTPLFALPGNPIATIVCARFLLEPFLRTLTFRTLETPRWAVVRSVANKNGVAACSGASSVSLSVGKLIHSSEGRLEVDIGVRNAAMVSPVAASDCWVMARGDAVLRVGSIVEVWSLDPWN